MLAKHSRTNFHDSINKSHSDNAKLVEDLEDFVTISIDEAIRNGCGGDVEVEVNEIPVIDETRSGR